MKQYYLLLLFGLCFFTSHIAYAQAKPVKKRWALSNEAVVLTGKPMKSKASVDSLNALTFEGWFKIKKSTQNATLFSIGKSLQFNYTNKKLILQISGEKIKVPFKNDENWHHFSIVINNEKKAISIAADGKILISEQIKNIPIISGHVTIGNRLYGQVDEVRLWAKPLEIEQLWSSTVLSVSHPFYNDLVGYWRFDKDAKDCKFTEMTDYKADLSLIGSKKYEKASNAVCYGMITGYLREGHLASNEISRAMLLCMNDIIFFSNRISINEDGSCVINDEPQFKANVEKLKELLKDVDGVSIRVGFHGGNFRKWMPSEQARENFAKDATNIVKKYDFDGLDFDFEWPLQWKENALWQNYAQTNNAIRKNAPYTIFSVSFGSWSCNLPNDGRAAVDYYTFQNYGPLSFRFKIEQFKNDANTYLKFNYPRDRTLLGHPFYGTCDKGGRYTRHYKFVVNKYKDLALDADQVEMPFGKDTFPMYFNGVETIRKKTKWAQDEKCLGIMTWDIAGDVEPTSKHSLIRAVNEFYGSLASPTK